MLTFLKKIKAKVRRFELPKAAKKVLLIVLSLLIFDALVAFLGAPYLSENIGTFLGKSTMVILSDLLFFEGAVVFTVGTFMAVLEFIQEKETLNEPSTETNDNGGRTRGKRIGTGIFVMIIGAILVGLSITVGTLFL